MRLGEIRLLEGPNVYRLAPVVKVEVALGRSRVWAGSRTDSEGILHLGRSVPAREWPDQVADLVAWTRRLRADHGEHGGPVAVHVPSDTGRWVVTWPWTQTSPRRPQSRTAPRDRTRQTRRSVTQRKTDNEVGSVPSRAILEAADGTVGPSVACPARDGTVRSLV